MVWLVSRTKLLLIKYQLSIFIMLLIWWMMFLIINDGEYIFHFNTRQCSYLKLQNLILPIFYIKQHTIFVLCVQQLLEYNVYIIKSINLKVNGY